MTANRRLNLAREAIDYCERTARRTSPTHSRDEEPDVIHNPAPALGVHGRRIPRINHALCLRYQRRKEQDRKAILAALFLQN